MPCLGATCDNEGTCFACILFGLQCAVCPIKCCDRDNDAMCWGCVCFRIQIDPCFWPRQCLHGVCAVLPCGCCAAETIETACCCQPGAESEDKKMTEV